jgi:hypothetical protein
MRTAWINLTAAMVRAAHTTVCYYRKDAKVAKKEYRYLFTAEARRRRVFYFVLSKEQSDWETFQVPSDLLRASRHSPFGLCQDCSNHFGWFSADDIGCAMRTAWIILTASMVRAAHPTVITLAKAARPQRKNKCYVVL